MNDKYYLIKETTIFYGEAGERSAPENKIRVSRDSHLRDLDLSKLYDEEFNVLEKDYDEGYESGFRAEDGGTFSFTTLKIKQISNSEYIQYSETIDSYNEILNEF